MLEFIFDLVPGNEPSYEYAPGHVTITTDRGTGTSSPDHYFMLAASLMDLLSGVKAFLLHGKMSGCSWSVIDTSFSVDFQRVTRRLKGQEKPIRIVCGNQDLGAVVEQELVQAILDGTRRFLRAYAGMLGEEEAELAAVTQEFATAFHLDGSGG
jgi:hypothetical protein